MSVSQFRRCVLLSTLVEGDKTWFPKWFGSYARFAFNSIKNSRAVAVQLLVSGTRAI
jgi:hypothetical protein